MAVPKICNERTKKNFKVLKQQMGAAQDKPAQREKKDGNINNILCCSECNPVGADPGSKGKAAVYKEWEKNMQGPEKMKNRKPSDRFKPPSTPASQKVKSRTESESTEPASQDPQLSAAGPAFRRSYSPSASYFIPAVAPTNGWDAERQRQLEEAVQQAARDTKLRPPGYRAMKHLKLEIAEGRRPSIYNDKSIYPRFCRPCCCL
jgi:hypothetical protein